MMDHQAILSGEHVIGIVPKGDAALPIVPAELVGEPVTSLRFLGGTVQSVKGRTNWHVDALGLLCAEPGDGGQAIAAAWDDRLVRDEAGWRVMSAADVLAETGRQLKTQIDAVAERQRLRWITPGTGQSMTYARKVEEARRLATEADPGPQAFPMLAASIGIDGADLAAVAATILAMDGAWGAIGGAIEARRLGLKREVEQAVSEVELAAIDIETGWPE